MKVQTKIMLSVAIVVLSAVCVMLFFINNSSLLLVVYNPITNTTYQSKVKKGDALESYLGETFIDGYTFIGYYVSGDFENLIDTSSTITTNLSIVAGYSKKITSSTECSDNLVGVDYWGDLSSSDIEVVFSKNYKYLDLSNARLTGEFNGINTNLRTLILPAGEISGINGFSALKVLKTSENTVINNSFNNCEKLSDIDISGTLTIENSFNNCEGLKSIQIPQTLTYINDSFINTELESISNNSSSFFVEKGVLYAVDSSSIVAKKAVSSLINVNLNSNTTRIDSYAFYNHKNLDQLTLNAKIESIDKWAFANSSIKTLNINQNNVLTIGSHSFYNCQNLQNINLGKGVETIEEFAFYNTGLASVNLENSVLSSLEEYSFASNKNLKTITLPNRQITLLEGVFSDCVNLETVNNLNTSLIAEKTFKNCGNLTNIINFSNIETVGNYAFLNCKSLADISSLANIKTVGVGAFENCVNIVEAQFFKLANIPENLFYNCVALTKFISNGSVQEFNPLAFENCHNLSSLSFSGSNYLCQDGVVYNSSKTNLIYYACANSNTSFTIPETVTSINNKYLSSAKNLTAITSLSDSFYSENGVLYSADKSTLISYPYAKTQTSFTVPEYVETICSYAFVNCPNLTLLTVNSNVSHLENACLWQISALATINLSFIGEYLENLNNGFLGWVFGAKNYSQNSFYVPTSLKELVITNQTNFSDYCLYDCSSLLVVKLSLADSISQYMFYGCTSLQTLTMSKPLESIGDYAFFKCLNLISLNIVYNVDLEASNISGYALTETPNGVRVTIYHNQVLSPEKLSLFVSNFGYKQYDWVWKTAIIS